MKKGREGKLGRRKEGMEKKKEHSWPVNTKRKTLRKINLKIITGKKRVKLLKNRNQHPT